LSQHVIEKESQEELDKQVVQELKKLIAKFSYLDEQRC